MLLVPRQLLLGTQWFFFAQSHEISSCACIAQFNKDTGCPRNDTCLSLLKVMFEFLIGCLLCLDSSLFWPGCGKCFEAKSQVVIHKSQVICFPLLRDCSSLLSVVQHPRPVVSCILSSVLVGYGGRASPKPVTPSQPEELLEM